jgi:hypothetical protein
MSLLVLFGPPLDEAGERAGDNASPPRREDGRAQGAGHEGPREGRDRRGRRGTREGATDASDRNNGNSPPSSVTMVRWTSDGVRTVAGKRGRVRRTRERAGKAHEDVGGRGDGRGIPVVGPLVVRRSRQLPRTDEDAADNDRRRYRRRPSRSTTTTTTAAIARPTSSRASSSYRHSVSSALTTLSSSSRAASVPNLTSAGNFSSGGGGSSSSSARRPRGPSVRGCSGPRAQAE